MKNILILTTALILIGAFANPAMANKDSEDVRDKERLTLITPEVEKAIKRNDGKLEGKTDDDKIVCRKVSKPGSRISRRVCMTAAEEKQRREDDRQALRSTRETEFPQPTAQ